MYGITINKVCLLFMLAGILSSLSTQIIRSSYGYPEPFANTKKLIVERVVSGLAYPTSMAFLGPNDILVLEKDTGKVQRIINGTMQPQPLLDVNVANQVERGMLGVAVSPKHGEKNKPTYVFLYYTESKRKDGSEPLGNRLYRYELINNTLVNPKLLLDLPAVPGPAHNGGVISIGPDNNIYVVSGNLHTEVYNKGYQDHSLAQNIKNGREPDGRGGILRVTQDGQVVNGTGILGTEYPLNLYYAYGLRNSFGMNFDPVTGKLWDTENGGLYDEINLVEPGFNSGWEKVIGKASLQKDFNEENLVNFNGKGKYSDPEFSWKVTNEFRTAPTALVFFNSDKFGREYENNMFVGDVNGHIYHFDLNKDRTQLLLNGSLADKVADNASEIKGSIFAKAPGTITDLAVGPDGYLYVTVYDKDGTIFRILPSRTNS